MNDFLERLQSIIHDVEGSKRAEYNGEHKFKTIRIADQIYEAVVMSEASSGFSLNAEFANSALMLICLKVARLISKAQRGVLCLDSGLDLLVYASLFAEQRASQIAESKRLAGGDRVAACGDTALVETYRDGWVEGYNESMNMTAAMIRFERAQPEFAAEQQGGELREGELAERMYTALRDQHQGEMVLQPHWVNLPPERKQRWIDAARTALNLPQPAAPGVSK